MTENTEDASNVLTVKSREDEQATESFIQQPEEIEITEKNMSSNTLQVSLLIRLDQYKFRLFHV